MRAKTQLKTYKKCLIRNSLSVISIENANSKALSDLDRN